MQRDACECALEGRTIRREHESGPHRRPHGRERPVVLRHQRVRGSNRCVRDADVERRQRKDRVLESVSGKNDDRALGGELPVQQRLRDRPRAIEGIAIRQIAARSPSDRVLQGTCDPAQRPPSARGDRSVGRDTDQADAGTAHVAGPASRG